MPSEVITVSFVSSSCFASAHAHTQVHVTDEDCNPLHVFSAFPGPVRFLKLTAGSANNSGSGSGSSEDSGPCLVALGSQDDGSTTLSSTGSSSSGGGGGSGALWALKIWKLSSLLASLPRASTSAEVGG